MSKNVLAFFGPMLIIEVVRWMKSENETKGNPLSAGGLLTSKPTWSNTCGCSTAPAFFFRRRETVAAGRTETRRADPLEKSEPDRRTATVWLDHSGGV
jgi:hypothetical protein